MENKSGVILINKPTNISSNGVVSRVKYLIKSKKVGHLGTLDPLASGVLPITFGKATRLFDYFLNKDKTYLATFAFSFETTTLDCEGEVTNKQSCNLTLEKINEMLKFFQGKISQLPPAYSALKVNGQKACDAIRKGVELNLKPRMVEIFSIKCLEKVKNTENLKQFFINNSKDTNKTEIINNYFNNIFTFEITCSAGTYIRSLCRDIARELKTFGTMVNLVRTRCGQFKLEDCNTIQDVENKNFKIIKTDDVIGLDSVNISENLAANLINGKTVAFEKKEQQFKLYCNNNFLGIANSRNGYLKIDVFLKEEN